MTLLSDIKRYWPRVTASWSFAYLGIFLIFDNGGARAIDDDYWAFLWILAGFLTVIGIQNPRKEIGHVKTFALWLIPMIVMWICAIITFYLTRSNQ